MQIAATCIATKLNGEPCTRWVVRNSSYCISHAPEYAEKRAEGSKRGGYNRANIRRLSKLFPTRLIPIWERLERALEETHSGELDPRIATALAQLARAMVAVLQAGEVEQRLRHLEETLDEQSRAQRRELKRSA